MPCLPGAPLQLGLEGEMLHSAPRAVARVHKGTLLGGQLGRVQGPQPFLSLSLSPPFLNRGTGEFALVRDLRREAIRKGVGMGDNSSRKLSALQSIKSAEK